MCFARIKAKDVIADSKSFVQPKEYGLKEERALNLISDDDFPGFVFLNVGLYKE